MNNSSLGELFQLQREKAYLAGSPTEIIGEDDRNRSWMADSGEVGEQRDGEAGELGNGETRIKKRARKD